MPPARPGARLPLPPGLDGLFDLAIRSVMRIDGMVMRGEVAWGSLPAAEQEEIDGTVAMLTEAGAQGHARANSILGALLKNALGHVEAVQTTDLPLLFEHAGVVLEAAAASAPASLEQTQPVRAAQHGSETPVLRPPTRSHARSSRSRDARRS